MENNKEEITLDKLAVMIKEGFDEMDGKIVELKSDVNELKSDVKDLKQGQEDIKLRLDNVAYRFELVDLQKRVEKLEKINNISNAQR
jgi:hypothetical protein